MDDLPNAAASSTGDPGLLDEDRLVAAVEQLALHRHEGRTSLHKPLAVLWAIGKLSRTGERLTSWPEFRREVGDVLDRFGPSRSRVTPQYPFWHLSTSPEIWEVHGVTDVPTSKDDAAEAGLTQDVAELLKDGGVRRRTVDLLVDGYLGDAVDRSVLLTYLGLEDRSAELPDAQSLLRALVGHEIATATGRANSVISVGRDTAQVRTDRSPDGQSVPIDAVQAGLDLLELHRTVRISPEILGHRSSFIGAVLASLPDARFTTDPVTVTLDPPTSEQAAGDRHFGELDGVARVKVRREQDLLRHMLTRGAKTASCALCGDEYLMEFLVAAHVKKRAECSTEERLDLRHVAMLACVFGCDALYETGWVTVDEDGVIRAHIPGDIPAGGAQERLRQLHGRRCESHGPRSEPYFAWHRTTVFRGAPPAP